MQYLPPKVTNNGNCLIPLIQMKLKFFKRYTPYYSFSKDLIFSFSKAP